MWDKLETLAARYEEIERRLADPKVLKSPDMLREAGREHAELRALMEVYARLKKLDARTEDAEPLAHGPDHELAALARDELRDLKEEREGLTEEIKRLLVPKDPLAGKNIILEIRAGTGGEEAALFARELFEMYQRFADNQGWRTEVLSMSAAEKGGFKEVIAQISGQEVYGKLRYESGVHRVQRVPVTEAQGRIHTSAVTVAVLAEAEELDVKIEEGDLKVDVFRSQGAGGQHVNTTDSAVRITHKPSGLVVVCQDERSQHKNRAKAMKILRARLLDLETTRQQQERTAMRRSMVGRGDRSEKIRTYNFPQNRVTDHRIGLTLHRLAAVMQGDLAELAEALAARDRAEQLASNAAANTESENRRTGA
ncbi:MAG TPA: peptide chain release factor 1 [bacterium]|nr:peptide chain release factor 1 [bacterium]